jgi:DNA-binding CsgD family transcriptional regulator
MARRSADASSPLRGLTDKEREVLEQMATGRTNATIARTLFMSERSVEKHISSVFLKLGLLDEGETNRRVSAVLTYVEATR